MCDVAENPERAPEFPFSKWDELLIEAFGKIQGRPRHCGMNAFRGLRRAWKIAPIDPEMALFRAITAEEEAATALMFALQNKHYPNAAQLQPRKHVHKAGMGPFFATVGKMLEEFEFPKPRVGIDLSVNPPRLEIEILSDQLGLGPGYVASPDEPLNAVLRQGKRGEGNGEVMDFNEELKSRALIDGKGSFIALVQEEANLRNRLLYASDNGWTVVEKPDQFILARRSTVVLLLALTVAVLQTPKHQLLARQMLDAYLRAVGRIPDDIFEYDGEPPEAGVTIQVEKVVGGRPEAKIIRRP